MKKYFLSRTLDNVSKNYENLPIRWPDCVHVQSFRRSRCPSTVHDRPVNVLTELSCHYVTVLDDLQPPSSVHVQYSAFFYRPSSVRLTSGDVGVVSTSYTSTYSAKMASKTSRTLTEMVLCGALQPNVMAAYFDPDAMVPGTRCVVSWCAGRFDVRSSSSKSAGGILMKLLKAASSSRPSSTISWSYRPNWRQRTKEILVQVLYSSDYQSKSGSACHIKRSVNHPRHSVVI